MAPRFLLLLYQYKAFECPQLQGHLYTLSSLHVSGPMGKNETHLKSFDGFLFLVQEHLDQSFLDSSIVLSLLIRKKRQLGLSL